MGRFQNWGRYKGFMATFPLYIILILIDWLINIYIYIGIQYKQIYKII